MDMVSFLKVHADFNRIDNAENYENLYFEDRKTTLSFFLIVYFLKS